MSERPRKRRKRSRRPSSPGTSAPPPKLHVDSLSHDDVEFRAAFVNLISVHKKAMEESVSLNILKGGEYGKTYKEYMINVLTGGSRMHRDARLTIIPTICMEGEKFNYELNKGAVLPLILIIPKDELLAFHTSWFGYRKRGIVGVSKEIGLRLRRRRPPEATRVLGEKMDLGYFTGQEFRFFPLNPKNRDGVRIAHEVPYDVFAEIMHFIPHCAETAHSVGCVCGPWMVAFRKTWTDVVIRKPSHIKNIPLLVKMNARRFYVDANGYLRKDFQLSLFRNVTKLTFLDLSEYRYKSRLPVISDLLNVGVVSKKYPLRNCRVLILPKYDIGPILSEKFPRLHDVAPVLKSVFNIPNIAFLRLVNLETVEELGFLATSGPSCNDSYKKGVYAYKVPPKLRVICIGHLVDTSGVHTLLDWVHRRHPYGVQRVSVSGIDSNVNSVLQRLRSKTTRLYITQFTGISIKKCLPLRFRRLDLWNTTNITTLHTSFIEGVDFNRVISRFENLVHLTCDDMRITEYPVCTLDSGYVDDGINADVSYSWRERDLNWMAIKSFFQGTLRDAARFAVSLPYEEVSRLRRTYRKLAYFILVVKFVDIKFVVEMNYQSEFIRIIFRGAHPKYNRFAYKFFMNHAVHLIYANAEALKMRVQTSGVRPRYVLSKLRTVMRQHIHTTDKNMNLREDPDAGPWNLSPEQRKQAGPHVSGSFFVTVGKSHHPCATCRTYSD